MIPKPPVSLVVGFPRAQSSRELAKLHRKFKLRQDEKLDIVNGYSIEVPANQLDSYLEALPESAKVMVDEPFFPSPKTSSPRRRRRGVRLSDSLESSPSKSSKPYICLLYTSPSPRDLSTSRMPSSA